MNSFEQWWEKEAINILRLLADSDGAVMDDIHRIARQTWDAATSRAARVVEERIKKTDLAVIKAEKEHDEETAIYLRSTSWVLGLLADEIKEMNNA